MAVILATPTLLKLLGGAGILGAVVAALRLVR
jgi:hypothetical protein